MDYIEVASILSFNLHMMEQKYKKQLFHFKYSDQIHHKLKLQEQEHFVTLYNSSRIVALDLFMQYRSSPSCRLVYNITLHSSETTPQHLLCRNPF